MSLSAREEQKEVSVPSPPEGGWGYAVSLATVIIFIVTSSHIDSYGIIYGGFIERIGGGVKGLTVIMGVYSVVLSLSGVLTNVILKWYSLRQLGTLAAVLLCSGWFFNFFASSVFQLCITIGVFQGMATGILMCVTLANFNQYFSKRRMSVTGICKMFIGIANVFCPLFVKESLESYGFRGTMLLFAAISTHAFLAILLIQPVEWHQKKQKYIEVPLKEVNTDNKPKENSAIKENESTFFAKCEDNKSNGELEHIHKNDKNIEDFEVLESEMSSYFIKERALSIESFGQTMILDPKVKDKGGLWAYLVNLLDMNLLKDPKFCNICVGLWFGVYTDSIFFMFLPLHLKDIGFTMREISLCIAAVSAADMVSRGFIGVLGSFVKFTCRQLFFIALIASCFVRIVFVHSEGFMLILALLCILGFLRAPFAIAAAIMFSECFPQRFTAAYGLSALFDGITGSILMPVFGMIKDSTESFPITFHIANSMVLICIIPWSIEFVLSKKKNLT